ncbi:hypothetical protein [Mesorhizobium sp. 43Arga]
MITKEISMLDIVKSGSIGPFTAGLAINEIGNEAGAPDYWMFSTGREMNFYLGYGPLEVYIHTEGNAGLINLVKLKALKFKRSAFIFKNEYKEKSLRLTIGSTWRTYESAQSALRRMSVNFSTEFQEIVKEDTSAVINIENSARLYFSHDNGREILDTIEC